MSAECQIFSRCRMGLLAGLLAVVFMLPQAYAQTVDVSDGASEGASAATVFQEQQQTLVQSWRALISQGATRQQRQAWLGQNASQLEELQQEAQTLSAGSLLKPMPVLAGENIPANVSGTVAGILATQGSFFSAWAQIRNQLLGALPQNPTQQEIEAMLQQEHQTFLQQYGSDLALLSQQAQALGEQSASGPLPIPGPPVFPPNATSAMQAYLTARDGLVRSRAQLWNEYITADPAARRTAMRQWCQQNAAQLEELQQLAENLANPPSNQQ